MERLSLMAWKKRSRKQRNKWLLLKGTPWLSICSTKTGTLPFDLYVDVFKIHDNGKYAYAHLSTEDYSRLPGVTGSLEILVSIAHLADKNDTRPMVFRHSSKSILMCIEELRENIYDGQRKRIGATFQKMEEWRERLVILKDLYYGSDYHKKVRNAET